MKFDCMGDTLIIRPQGELDHHYAAKIREMADAIIHKGGIRKVIFDFTHIGFMDSSGIGVIMGRYRLMEAVGGCVCIFGASERIKELIEMSGLKRIITLCDNEKQALEVNKK